MRLKIGQSVIKADQDNLSITVSLDYEQADQVIQLLIEDETVYQTTLNTLIS